MALNNILKILESCSSDSPLIPPTELYNEGWLLRLILDWFSRNSIDNHPLNFNTDAIWYSEALLPSAFLNPPKLKPDPLAESYTHADGVIGHFKIGNAGKGDLSLNKSAKQFIVIEAKIFSNLSPGVTNAKYYDQAARSVACIAETLHRVGVRPYDMLHIGFFLFAPQTQISAGVFDTYMTYDSIKTKVQKRVAEYKGEKDKWYEKWFKPTFESIQIITISWEHIIEDMTKAESSFGNQINEFYQLCLKYNSKIKK